ncbi:MAG: MvaI/BcnI restriction endonuclease family protein [Bacteroidales bacterium]|jgi:hypothetical protein|nr:MvaI/BcnI restriction endonuclease family protein [Bacteroidales bacterium]MDD2205011.1 MvaI/BcnI restriction endonuclease family protein [Bacteroidales bacterium]MDD3914489.1 MvaI/BcnI restriction endonuclease family protein [Bacteroidales bacterium]MDD4634412.1 MvaI/BcnI restriction endonuclease family protein [Bacteroidales bacterium]
MTNKEFIIQQFKKVKKLGFLKSNRKNNTGIGKTFEDYIGVVENNINEPDLAGYEIKSHRELAQSYITLFTKSPSFPKGANAYLKDKFGTPYEENPDLKKLHTSMFANKANTYAGKYTFQLINDKTEKKILIGVYSIKTKKLLDSSCGYSYADIEKVLSKKLKNLFYVSAETKTENGQEHFNFNQADIYENPSFKKFINLLDKGLIMYDIRIGSYQSGSNYGKPHDHGSDFRILEKNLCKLYSKHEKIE